MAHPQAGRARGGAFVSPIPPFPPPQHWQGTHPPPPYPSSQNPYASEGFPVLGQVQQQPQHHPSNFGGRFPGTPFSRTGYGFHGPPRSRSPQVPLEVGIPGPATNVLPEMLSGPPGIGFGHHRNSFGVSSPQNVSEAANLGLNATLPPGTGSGHFGPSNCVRLLEGIPGVKGSGYSTTPSQSGGCAQQIWNSNHGAAPPAIAPAAAIQSSSIANRGFANSELQKEDHHLANVVELAVLQARQGKNVDLKEVLLQIRSLISQVERVAEQVETLVKIDLSSSKPPVVACPFDPAHNIVAEGLFQHYLRCPSKPKSQLNIQSLMDSLQYRRALHTCSSTDTSSGPSDSSRMATAEVTSGAVSSSRTEFDIWGGRFFYEGATAVVQAPLCTVHPPSRDIPPLPVFEVPVRSSKDSKLMDAGEPSSARETSLLLPSRYFFLSKEIESWHWLPSRASSLVIEAAVGLEKVPKPTLVSWLLVNSPAHGIVIDSTLACHIYTLSRSCFQEVHNEAYALLESADYRRVAVTTAESLNDIKFTQTGEANLPNLSQFDRTTYVQTDNSNGGDLIAMRSFCPRVGLLDCARVFRSIDWLSAKLSPLYGSSPSRKFTLNLLKHSVVLSGRLLSNPLIETFEKSKWGSRCKMEEQSKDGREVAHNLEYERTESLPFDLPVVSDDVPRTKLVTVGDSSSLVLELEAAVAAVNERAVLERYLRTPLYANRLPKFQLIQEYEVAVKFAAEERRKRPNYRPVLDSDGLIWHRSQLEEKNKNKTREEILAEERDYKRRRMSYRGKKLKRTPTQVVRDIIDGHMEEIMEAGGIGCAVKQSVQALPKQISSGELSVACNEFNVADGEQLTIPARNSSSVGRAPSSLHVLDKGGASGENSHSHVETWKSNEGLGHSFTEMNTSKDENSGGREATGKPYQFKSNTSMPRYSKFKSRVEDSNYLDHDGDKRSNVNYRSTPDDHREFSRIGNEASSIRATSSDHYQSERYSLKRLNDSNIYESEVHDDNRERKPRQGSGHDAPEDQGKRKSTYEKYGEDRDLGEERSRRHSDKSEGRKKERNWDRYESESEQRVTSKSRHR